MHERASWLKTMFGCMDRHCGGCHGCCSHCHSGRYGSEEAWREHKLQKNPPEKLDDQIMCLDERIKTLENFDNIRIKMLETKLLEYEDRMKSLLEEEEKKNDKQIKFLTDMVDKISEELASCRNALIRMETSPPAGTDGSSHSSDAGAMVDA